MRWRDRQKQDRDNDALRLILIQAAGFGPETENHSDHGACRYAQQLALENAPAG